MIKEATSLIETLPTGYQGADPLGRVGRGGGDSPEWVPTEPDTTITVGPAPAGIVAPLSVDTQWLRR